MFRVIMIHHICWKDENGRMHGGEQKREEEEEDRGRRAVTMKLLRVLKTNAKIEQMVKIGEKGARTKHQQEAGTCRSTPHYTSLSSTPRASSTCWDQERWMETDRSGCVARSTEHFC
jgi:hypothetical protein